MGGTFIRLVDQGHEVSIAYMTNGGMAVHDEDVVNRLSFMRQFMKTFDLKSDKVGAFADKAKEFFRSKDSSTIDLPDILEIKSLIRKREAQTAYRYCGVDDANAFFLDLPFYKTGKAQKNPISQVDIDKVKQIMKEV